MNKFENMQHLYDNSKNIQDAVERAETFLEKFDPEASVDVDAETISIGKQEGLFFNSYTSWDAENYEGKSFKEVESEVVADINATIDIYQDQQDWKQEETNNFSQSM